jgi:hypothetical protein
MASRLMELVIVPPGESQYVWEWVSQNITGKHMAAYGPQWSKRAPSRVEAICCKVLVCIARKQRRQRGLLPGRKQGLPMVFFQQRLFGSNAPSNNEEAISMSCLRVKMRHYVFAKLSLQNFNVVKRGR